MLQDELLKTLKTELETNKGIEDIVIFGSAARTNFQQYNDIDILIVFKDALNLDQQKNLISNLEKRYNIRSRPVLDYILNKTSKKPVLNYILNYDPFYDISYCKQKDLGIDHIFFKNIKEDNISLKESSNELITV